MIELDVYVLQVWNIDNNYAKNKTYLYCIVMNVDMQFAFSALTPDFIHCHLGLSPEKRLLKCHSRL